MSKRFLKMIKKSMLKYKETHGEEAYNRLCDLNRDLDRDLNVVSKKKKSKRVVIPKYDKPIPPGIDELNELILNPGLNKRKHDDGVEEITKMCKRLKVSKRKIKKII